MNFRLANKENNELTNEREREREREEFPKTPIFSVLVAFVALKIPIFACNACAFTHYRTAICLYQNYSQFYPFLQSFLKDLKL